MHQLPSALTLTGDQTYNPGTCSEQESNWQPFALWDNTQPSEPHGSGPGSKLLLSTWHVPGTTWALGQVP